jgi:hypothetical protein
MSLSITQTPATCSLAQSPTIFTLAETGDVVLSASFQYYADLYYWDGTTAQSSSMPEYTLVKFPNASRVGIFDVSRIINSTLQDTRQENPSNIKYFKIDGYFRYLSGSAYTTSSHVESAVFKGLDGYGVFPEQIGQSITTTTPHWPLMTSGPVSQSFFDSNTGTIGVYTGGAGSVAAIPTKVRIVSDLGTTDINVSSSISSSQQIQQVPMFPAQTGFPYASPEWYTIQAYNGSTALGTPIYFDFKCEQKYPNIRIKWKNRFGQFDYFNFDMVNKQSFNTTTRGYQPQLGTWTGTSLQYNSADSSNLNYIVDSKQSIVVNTDWIPEAYNDIIKQILVSEEIYWIKDESSTVLTPITIATDSITFKTGVVDKVIQYSFEFNYGQGYKLIL